MGARGMFRDREDAGEQLAEALKDRGVEADIVLAIPRGGLPLGRAVADALGAPLDIVVAKKIGALGNPEYALGAVASDGAVWRNEAAIRGTGARDEYFARKREEEEGEARRKAERYRNGGEPPDLAGKRVVVVDDGVATGSTTRACLKGIKARGAAHIVLAVPVGPPDRIEELRRVIDEVVCLMTPAGFRGVGQFYQRFDQVSDTEAMTYLET